MEKIDHNITVNREEYDSLVKKLQITGIYGMYIVASKQVNRPDNCSVDSSLYPQDTDNSWYTSYVLRYDHKGHDSTLHSSESAECIP